MQQKESTKTEAPPPDRHVRTYTQAKTNTPIMTNRTVQPITKQSQSPNRAIHLCSCRYWPSSCLWPCQVQGTKSLKQGEEGRRSTKRFQLKIEIKTLLKIQQKVHTWSWMRVLCSFVCSLRECAICEDTVYSKWNRICRIRSMRVRAHWQCHFNSCGLRLRQITAGQHCKLPINEGTSKHTKETHVDLFLSTYLHC